MDTLSKESAQKELDRLMEYYEIDIEDLGKDQKEALESIQPVLIKGIQRGFISFESEDGFTIIQKLKSGDEIKYKEMNGAAKILMDKKGENESTSKCYALLGSLSSLGEAGIKKLKGPDLKRAEHIGLVLLFC